MVEPSALPQTMLGLRLHALQTPVRVDQLPVPDVGDEDVLIQTRAIALSASAVRLVSSKAVGSGRQEDRLFPQLLAGHPAGQVVRAGRAVPGLGVGDRVILVTQPNCNVCLNCRADRNYICLARFRKEPSSPRSARQGGMSEYVRAHFRDLIKLPDWISFGMACYLGPLATPYRSVKRTGLKPGESIIISGATGTYGFRALLAALAMEAGLLIALGRNTARLQHIRQMAPQRIETVVVGDGSIEDRVRELTAGWGAHRLVDFLPGATEVTRAALRALRPGGTAVLTGEGGDLGLSYSHIQQYGLEITGSGGASYFDYLEVLGLLEQGLLRLDDIELRPFPFDQANAAIDLMADQPGGKPIWSYLSLS
jgi:alcohol dehydrogenase